MTDIQEIFLIGELREKILNKIDNYEQHPLIYVCRDWYRYVRDFNIVRNNSIFGIRYWHHHKYHSHLTLDGRLSKHDSDLTMWYLQNLYDYCHHNNFVFPYSYITPRGIKYEGPINISKIIKMDNDNHIDEIIAIGKIIILGVFVGFLLLKY